MRLTMTNDINFNKDEYIRLLKKNKFLLLRKLRRDLLSYGAILENQMYYDRKTEYISLIKEYLSENAGKDGCTRIS